MDSTDKRLKVRKGRATHSPQSNQTHHYKKGSVDVILQEITSRLYGQPKAKRGGSGRAAKLNPDPRTTHRPKRKVQVVCK
jgi:hypothetical protein